MNYRVFLIVVLLFFSCSEKEESTLALVENSFEMISSQTSDVTFSNDVKESYQFNFLSYPYIYIGAGVAIGDINNDGLEDIYFASNQGDNALYLNKGELSFDDISVASGVTNSGGWSTGVSMVDINNDGWLDIYVCNSASLNSSEGRKNKLYINNKDNTFTEAAARYGLDHNGFSTQAYWLDYDKDGDLDMYLVNHRYDFANNSRISSEIQRAIQDETSDHLFRNDNQKFTKVSGEAGILNKAWGLSAAIGDFNNDSWPDIYVANDYLEPDMLFINQQNGTFKNEILNSMNHISFNSMGSDFADINNDLELDLMVLDMLAEDHSRGKENMATMSTENFYSMVNVGYHRQYMSNILQLNHNNGTFSDIGQLAGITKTDWSWAPLLVDLDNDEYKDVFITNGIEKDLGNQDFRRKMFDLNRQGVAMTLDSLLSIAPGAKLKNYVFKNNKDLTFSKMNETWGFDEKINSNGVAYGDLDNDGDQDLVINNYNDTASIYKNNASVINNAIRIKLIGDESNTLGIGAKVKVTTATDQQIQEMYLNRGFLSSVSNQLLFGIGKNKTADIEVTWPSGEVTRLENVKVTKDITIDFNETKKETVAEATQKKSSTHLSKVSPETLGLNFKHIENPFNDFDKQVLLPQKQSSSGPCLAIADINGDDLDDVFVGSSIGQSPSIFIQTDQQSFIEKNVPIFEKDRDREDTAVLFVDIDNDQDLDLYIASGGYELEEQDVKLQDRLYINDGKGAFVEGDLPDMKGVTSAVKAIDFDNDGDQDLILGGGVVPGKYPLTSPSYILENNQGNFQDVTNTIAPDFMTIGDVGDIEILDINGDGQLDFMVAGSWFPLTVFINSNGDFEKMSLPEFEKSNGWYNSILAEDFDSDGDKDFIVGNLGKNNKFQPSEKKPLHIFSGYFDDNPSYDMALSKVYKGELVPVRGKECSTEQTPFLSEKIGTYKEFASLNIEGVYGSENIENANHAAVYNFSSIYIENLGNGQFSIQELPNLAQLGPTLDLIAKDINKDGHIDIVGVGNLYDAEVETIRYDASRGYVLYGNGKGQFDAFENESLAINKDMRAVQEVRIGSASYVLIANNMSGFDLFQIAE